MKKTILLLPLILLCSCHDKNKMPDPAIVARHQPLFGNKPVDTPLSKVFYDNHLIGEFEYNEGYVAKHLRHLAFNKPALFASGLYERHNRQFQSYELKMAKSYSAEAQTVSPEMVTQMLVSFPDAVTNTTSEMLAQWLVKPKSYKTVFSYDANGFIITKKVSPQGAIDKDYAVSFERNSENNVVKSISKENDSFVKGNEVDYQHDNKPNIFFNLGFDWTGLPSIHSLSPNNITEEIYMEQDNVHRNVYTYEYLPNGFPNKITVTSYFNDITGNTYTISLKYED